MKKFYKKGIIQVVPNNEQADSYRIEIRNDLYDENGNVNGSILKSILLDNKIKVGMNTEATKQIRGLFHPEDYSALKPKPCSLIQFITSTVAVGSEVVLDFFAGSGTTAHAVLNLNREDGGRRSFILVEMGEYFDTVLLPRIKKIIFTPEWKDGKPNRLPTKEESERTPRLIKYHHFESYDDALENITFQGNESTSALFENYTARYMLKEESRASATFCPNEKLETPLDFKLLRANRDDKIAEADLPETFAYLVGLREKRRQTLRDGKRRYIVQSGDIDGRQTVVIWRNTANWTDKDYENDREFIKSKRLTEHAEQIYINNDSMVKNAESLTTIFKAKMLPDSDEI